MKISAQPVRLN